MKKIMFYDFLTQAVIDQTKNMTRRIVPEKTLKRAEAYVQKIHGTGHDFLDYLLEHAPYKVGEVVAVAQAYKDTCWTSPVFRLKDKRGWSNKMFVYAGLMPHQIRITNVRIERLQDISDEDCKKEGIDYVGGYSESYYFGHGVGNIRLGNSYREAFATLIDKVSGKGTWESNPWIFAYEFELIT